MNYPNLDKVNNFLVEGLNFHSTTSNYSYFFLKIKLKTVFTLLHTHMNHIINFVNVSQQINN